MNYLSYSWKFDCLNPFHLFPSNSHSPTSGKHQFDPCICESVSAQFCLFICTTMILQARLKILQARLQQYVNHEIPDVQAGFRKGRGTRDQVANIHWIIEKAREFQRNIYFCFIDYIKAFNCMDHNKLWKTLQEMGITDHLICLLKTVYAGQEATVRTGHETVEWF